MPEKITAAADGTLQVSDEPIIPFIEGDGTGVDIVEKTKNALIDQEFCVPDPK